MRKFLNNALYALNGVLFFFRTERNGKIELVITVLTLGMSYWLRISLLELTVLLLCIALIIAGEMINTSIERVCNYMTLDHHPEIGRIKDLAAGAVLILSVFAGVIGLIVFVPKILAQF